MTAKTQRRIIRLLCFFGIHKWHMMNDPFERIHYCQNCMKVGS